MNQNRYSKIFTKKKVASSAVCVVLAISLFAGCAHFESIEYSQEISEENPQTVEAFDQFINDIFETEVTENTINLHLAEEGFNLIMVAINSFALSRIWSAVKETLPIEV